jgi:hypothetical protein
MHKAIIALCKIPGVFVYNLFDPRDLRNTHGDYRSPKNPGGLCSILVEPLVPT